MREYVLQDGIAVTWSKHARCAAEWLALRAEHQKAAESLDAATTIISERLKARQAPTKAELRTEARARRRLAAVRRRLIVYSPPDDARLCEAQADAAPP